VLLKTTRAEAALALAKPPPLRLKAPTASKTRPDASDTKPNEPLLKPADMPPAARLALTSRPAMTKAPSRTDTPTVALSDTSPTAPVSVPDASRYSPPAPLLLKVLLLTVMGVAVRSSRLLLAAPPARFP